jgi:hypothetical protein
VLDLLALDLRPVHATVVGQALRSEVHRPQVRECAPGPDQHRAAPVADWEDGSKPVAHRGPKFLQAARAGPVAEVLLSHADGSIRQRLQALHHAVRAHREFQRAAAYVHHHGTPLGQVEVRQGGAEGEACLVLPVEYADAEPGFLAYQVHEVLLVLRLAHRRGGHRMDP